MLGGGVGQCDQAVCVRLLIGASQIEVPILPQRLVGKGPVLLGDYISKDDFQALERDISGL